MATLLSGAPCGWVVSPCDPDCFPDESPGPESPGDSLREQYEAMAADMLWRWTGQRFGACEVTVRPCRQSVPCGRCGMNLYGPQCCQCRTLAEIVLPGPVVSVSAVWVDGEELDETAYRVDDSAWLVRLDGAEWPHCSDLLADPDEPGSFVVTYTQGVPPPAGAGLVAGELACELYKAFCNDKGCRLPKRITRKTRQGVTVEFGDGLGIPSIDEWVKAANTPRQRSSVWSPDLEMPPRITTWP